MEKLKKYNINSMIFVRLKSKGIDYYVKKFNSVMPLKMHTNYEKINALKNEYGYHQFQMWDLISVFGNLGMRIQDYMEIDIFIKEEDLKNNDL